MKLLPIRFTVGKPRTCWFVNVQHPRGVVPMRHDFLINLERIRPRTFRGEA